MKKRLVAVLLLAVMALTISAYASTRASVIQPGLSFAGTNANCSLIVAGDLGNESISATIKLNRGSINLKTWYTTGTGDLLFSDSSITTPKGYSYMVSNRIATYVPSETEYAKANEILDLYNTVNSGGNVTKHSTGSAYLENWKKLRYGNLIELTLDYDEGIDNLLVLRCTGYATDAKNDAVEYYPQYTDSAQHFMWNYLMTERVSKTVARTVGNNHEWGIAMINSMLNAYDGYYNKYLKEGMSEDAASSNALKSTVLYMPVFKYDSVTYMQSSYEFFKSFFSAESVMDFWNNCYGRAYPEKGYPDAVKAFSYAGFIANELVLDASGNTAGNLTEAQTKSVWAWDWYSY